MSAKDFVAGELMAATKLILKGFKISMPIGHLNGYDLITDWFGKLNRIQIKTTTCQVKDGSWAVRLKKGTKRKRYSFEDTDFILARITETGETFVVPIEYATKYSTLFLSNKKDKKISKFKEAYDLLK